MKTTRVHGAKLAALLCWQLACLPQAFAGAEAGTDAEDAAIDPSGAKIGRIRIHRENVFDTSLPEEDNWFYRLANRWHILTREEVIRRQLLFSSGDTWSGRLVDESERLLRRNDYLYDAQIEPVRLEDGVVDLRVTTKDLWSLTPGFSLSRSGGENRTRFSVSEQNLVGTGARVKMSYTDDVDRQSTSAEYFNNNFGDSWVSVLAQIADNSDGETEQLRILRPFYALDTRWSAGIGWWHDDAEVEFYDLGNEVAEYREDQHVASVFAGWSDGLKNGRVVRWTAGIALDEHEFSETASMELPQLIPEDRRLLYPFVGVEYLQDRYQTTSNRDQIDRTEDFYMGTRLGARLGYAADGLGSDRDALIYDLSASTAFGSIEDRALLLASSLTGRLEDGRVVNALWHVDARYYRQQSRKRLFFMTLNGTYGWNLDLDNPVQLGGDNGLRGYPLRYQVGRGRLLFRIEERYFTDWYPFRLVRVGGAIFADIGRTWGSNPVGGEPLGWLKDIGIGLRLGPTRASGNDIIHIDLAFPLDGDASIDDVQILLESKRSF